MYIHKFIDTYIKVPLPSGRFRLRRITISGSIRISRTTNNCDSTSSAISILLHETSKLSKFAYYVMGLDKAKRKCPHTYMFHVSHNGITRFYG